MRGSCVPHNSAGPPPRPALIFLLKQKGRPDETAGTPSSSSFQLLASSFQLRELEHPAHSAAGHTAARCASALLFVFLHVGDESFGRQHQTCNRSGVLESETRYLRRIDDAG